eukprot:Sspe_Gene.50036::Locus_27507_Transcript_1_1_Confidence_1.000_Length_949::g.50036::m.50036
MYVRLCTCRKAFATYLGWGGWGTTQLCTTPRPSYKMGVWSTASISVPLGQYVLEGDRFRYVGVKRIQSEDCTLYGGSEVDTALTDEEKRAIAKELTELVEGRGGSAEEVTVTIDGTKYPTYTEGAAAGLLDQLRGVRKRAGGTMEQCTQVIKCRAYAPGYTPPDGH